MNYLFVFFTLNYFGVYLILLLLNNNEFFI